MYCSSYHHEGAHLSERTKNPPQGHLTNNWTREITFEQLRLTFIKMSQDYIYTTKHIKGHKEQYFEAWIISYHIVFIFGK